jgi:hypothetical protein
MHCKVNYAMSVKVIMPEPEFLYARPGLALARQLVPISI